MQESGVTELNGVGVLVPAPGFSVQSSIFFTFFDNLHGQSILRVLLYWKSVSSSVVCNLCPFPTIHAICARDLLLSVSFGERSLFLVHLRRVARQCPIRLIWEWSMVISSFDLSDNSKLREGLNEMRTFLTCHLCLICFFWNNENIERELRRFCFLLTFQLCLKFLQLSRFQRLLSNFMP